MSTKKTVYSSSKDIAIAIAIDIDIDIAIAIAIAIARFFFYTNRQDRQHLQATTGETKRNETKRNETKRNETKASRKEKADDPFHFVYT